MSSFTTALALVAALAPVAKGFFLMGVQNYIATERVDPIMYPGNVSNHVHTIMGGSNFGLDTNISALRDSECTSMPIAQDKSNYWFPHLYFQWANGSYTSLDAASTVYYLYGDDADVKAFPDDFRMIAGDENLRTFDNSSVAQRAISYKCLQFDGKPMEDYPGLPPVSCPAGIRAQINFPSCWDGQNVDSEDHKSHMAYPSDGPDKGTCNDPAFNVTVPRVFIEVSWYTMDWDKIRDQAMNASQPYVLSNGDSTGYSYHADYIYAWEPEVLQTALDTCACMTDAFGAYDCCEVFEKKADGERCYISSSVNEQVVGTLDVLPGYEPYAGTPDSADAGSGAASSSATESAVSSSAMNSAALSAPSDAQATQNNVLTSASTSAETSSANANAASAPGASFAPSDSVAAPSSSSAAVATSSPVSASGSYPAETNSPSSASFAPPPTTSDASSALLPTASVALLPTASSLPPIISGQPSVFTDAAPAPIMTAQVSGAGQVGASASAAGQPGETATEQGGAFATVPSESAFGQHRRRFIRAKRPVA